MLKSRKLLSSTCNS